MHEEIKNWIHALQKVDHVNDYEQQVEKMKCMLMEMGVDPDVLKEINERSKFVKSTFSGSATIENMKRSKEDLVTYLYGCIKNQEEPTNQLEFLLHCLKRFPLFLKALRELPLHKSSRLKKEDLEKIKIQNEYDFQHLLYAILKPMYEDIRKEVSEDSGVACIRADLKIPSLKTVIEAKCTRDSMKLRDLTEEVEADIVHYSSENIIFVVYDLNNIITQTSHLNKCYAP